MTGPQIEIQLIASLVAIACALPGVFLVLRRMALMSDAISHAILLGIVVAFFLTKDLTSPLLVVFAGLTGVLTVVLVELLRSTRRIAEDASIGLVFPILFSIGVILISRYAGQVHLDTDSVLLGELAFAPFDRLVVLGYDIGPRAAYMMGGILILNLAFIVIFFKELKIATFDSALAASLGFSPILLQYSLMSLVSITAVGAFDAVGSILVVALMIAPPSAAYLLTDRLSRMISLSALFGVISAVAGYWAAHAFDVSIAGSMATVAGILFGGAFLFAPERGLVVRARLKAGQRVVFAERMLIVHLAQHEGGPEEEYECRVEHLEKHMRWSRVFAARVMRHGFHGGVMKREDDRLYLTGLGRKIARQAVVE